MVALFFQLILDTLEFLHQYTGNYGWDIMILTLAVRLILFPITLKGLRGMKAMQAHQPRLKEIQEKYKDDREKLNKEIMAFYKEVGFNPMSSCLPMLLQLPIFIGLYRVLSLPELNHFILVNESFYGMNLTSSAFTKLSPALLKDLSLVMPGMIDLSFLNFSYFQGAYLYTPVLIVVVLMSVTTIAQQKMMTVDPQQQSTMWMMNIFIVVISFIIPAGVLLYWGVSNVLQFVQQAMIKLPDDPKSVKKKDQKSGTKLKSAKGKEDKAVKKPEKSGDNIEKTGKKKSPGKKEVQIDASQVAAGKKTYPASKQKSGSKKKKRKKKKKKK